MTDLRKAAQMALDWRDKNGELLFALGGCDFIFEINEWSQSLRGALAQSEREWQGLTDEEIENCFEMSMFGTCRSIEAKLKEKNG